MPKYNRPGGLRLLILLISSWILGSSMQACIEDSVSLSPADQPTFSVDTLDLGTVFTGAPTPTASFMVYNRHSKVMSISSVTFSDNPGQTFRINVDGQSGTSFAGIEIRPNDSIYVFVEATLAEWGDWRPAAVTATLDFVTNGVTSSVTLSATGQDIERHHGTVITADTRWSADRPRQIFDSLVVASGATLTLDAGTVLHFHDKALMRVDGTLVTEGTAELPVEMCGDRTGNVVGDISFDIMSGQWAGLTFSSSSHGSRMSHTVVRNTVGGVLVDSLAGTSDPDRPALDLHNCRLRNSAGYALEARHTRILAIGCEFADASLGCVRLEGGEHHLTHCTIANYYLFTPLYGAALQLTHAVPADAGEQSPLPLLQAEIANTIIYGNGKDLSLTDLDATSVTLRRCLLKSSGEDDSHFINCIWDTDPLYHTVREEYFFDYSLREDSPALGQADRSLTPVSWTTDFYGRPVGSLPPVGAFAARPD